MDCLVGVWYNTGEIYSKCLVQWRLGVGSTILSKPNVTQLNSNELNRNFVEVRHSSHLEPTTPPTNFSVTCSPARELKFGTDTH